ncbi:hypothetical protein AAF712_014285, partial [Marasmius tenuissimus]
MGWSRDHFQDPFDIALLYLGTNNQPFTTQTLGTSLGVTFSKDRDKNQHGTLIFAAMATG